MKSKINFTAVAQHSIITTAIQIIGGNGGSRISRTKTDKGPAKEEFV